MKKNIAIIYLNLLFSFNLFASSASCNAVEDSFQFDPPNENFLTCHYYLHRELDQTCGPKGYYIRFAYKFCSKLLSPKKFIYDFSDDGYRWITKVGICLQKELHKKRCQRIAQNKERLSCDAVEVFAMESHINCYITPDKQRPEISICRLSPLDFVKLARVIKSSIFNKTVRKQIKKVRKACFRKLKE